MRQLNCLFIMLFICMTSSYALKNDLKEKILIAADSGVYNYKTGIRIFEGNVKVDQGTTHVTSDRLITRNNKEHKIQEAIAYGIKTPAHYWTLQNPGEPEMHALAQIIKYYPLLSNVALEENVEIIQAENNFKGPIILYNMNEQTITVPAAKNARAVLVYNPDK